jgi:hypothetical protein
MNQEESAMHNHAVGQRTFPNVRFVPRIAHRLFAASGVEKTAYRSVNAG